MSPSFRRLTVLPDPAVISREGSDHRIYADVPIKGRKRGSDDTKRVRVNGRLRQRASDTPVASMRPNSDESFIDYLMQLTQLQKTSFDDHPLNDNG